MKVGDAAQPSTAIASAPVDASGQFTLHADPATNSALAAALTAANTTNNGWLNFDLIALGNGKMTYEAIPRHLVGGQWKGPTDSAQIAPAAPAVNLAPKSGLTTCSTLSYVVDEGNTNTTVGELHTGDNQTAWFRYGTSADSSIEVGYQNPIGSAWSVSGTVHVGNGLSAYVQWNEGAQWGYKVRSNFHYKKYHNYLMGCGIEWLTVKSSAWNSGSVLGDNVHSLDNNCRNSSYRASYSPNSDFQRSSYNATWFTGAASAFGAGLRAQSGFSSYVISHWHHGSAYPAYYHCGSDAFPNTAHRVYSGW